MWPDNLSKGLELIRDDFGSAMDEFIIAADEADEEELENCFDTVIESILDVLCVNGYPEETMFGFAELSQIFSERTDGELFLPTALTDRAVAYADGDSAYSLLSGIMGLTPYGLCATFDPEDYLLVLDSLVCLAATCRHVCSDEKVGKMFDLVNNLKGEFTERFRTLDDDRFFGLAEKFETDDDNLIPLALHDYLVSGSTESLNGFLEIYFES